MLELFKNAVLRIHVAYVDVGAAAIAASLHQRAKDPLQELIAEFLIFAGFSLLHVVHNNDVRTLILPVDASDCSSCTNGAENDCPPAKMKYLEGLSIYLNGDLPVAE